MGGGPPQVAQLYDFPAPPPGIGTQAIGIIEFGGGWTPGDIAATFAGWSASGTPPTPTDIPAASNNPGVNPAADGEVMLDICTASSVAPGAKIRVYWGSDSLTAAGWSAVLSAIIDDPERPSVVTTSIFLSDGDDVNTLGLLGMTQGQLKALSGQFQSLAALGVTVLAASGDDGARSLTRDGLRHVQYPGSDPWVTSCGGTSISTSPDYVEWAWDDIYNDPENGPRPFASGGGVSACFTGSLPAWQQGVDVPPSLNDNTTIGRGVPDVAGNASLNTAYMLTVDSASTRPLGGTSAVAPLYAGLMALVNASLSAPVGFLNPTLYAFRDTVCRDINDQAYQGRRIRATRRRSSCGTGRPPRDAPTPPVPGRRRPVPEAGSAHDPGSDSAASCSSARSTTPACPRSPAERRCASTPPRARARSAGSTSTTGRRRPASRPDRPR